MDLVINKVDFLKHVSDNTKVTSVQLGNFFSNECIPEKVLTYEQHLCYF